LNLKQLSELLNLSQTTISRALNGYPEVSERTRFRVVEAARKHGYKPNSNARKLATGRAGSIGYVLPVGKNVDLDPHFVEFLSGMGEHALAREVDLSLTPAPYEKESEAYRRIAASRSVDGVYLSSMRNDEQRIALVRGLGCRSWRMAGRSSRLMAMPVWTSTTRARFTPRRGCYCNWGTGGSPI
jgi:LacI family transcriptional regulator